jgi:hypothetical protein
MEIEVLGHKGSGFYHSRAAAALLLAKAQNEGDSQ